MSHSTAEVQRMRNIAEIKHIIKVKYLENQNSCRKVTNFHLIILPLLLIGL